MAERASFRCEYCLLSEDDSFTAHQLDHIISRKHGGASDVSNSALACIRCNAWKGSDIELLDDLTGVLMPLFHPRRDVWREHFRLEGALIEPLTAVGRVTAKLLRLNIAQRVTERRLTVASGRLPGIGFAG